MADVTVGRSVPLQPGPQPSSSSVSGVLATDHPPIAVFDAYEGASEIKQDLLGNPRFGTPQLLFANVRRYDIDSKIWASRVDSNNQGRIQFDSAKSSAKLSLNNADVVRGYASLQTKINFPYQPGRSMDCSFGVQCSRGVNNQNVVIEFGAFDNFDGYGFRILYENNKNKMFAFRRTSSGEAIGLLKRDDIPYLANHSELMDANAYEQIVEISNSSKDGYTINTNGNRLDGSLNGAVDVNGNTTSCGHTLSLHNGDAPTAMNLTMFRIRYSWYGASGADFWAYVPINKPPKPNQPRWVRMWSFPIGDTLQFPSLKNPDKPLTFRIYRRGNLSGSGSLPSLDAFLSTFGTSFSIDAGDPTPMEIYSAASQVVTVTATPTPVLAIQIKASILSGTSTISGNSVSTPNQLRAYPLQLSISSSGQVAFSLIKNPTFTGTFPAAVAGDLSAISVASSLGTVTATTGKICGTFYCGTSDGQTIDLTEIFAYNREFLAREAQATGAGDTLYVVATLLSGSSASVSASLVWGQQ